jgi:hypothetical protein
MKHQAEGELGHHMAKMGGILDRHQSITDATRYTSTKPGESALSKQLNFPGKFKLPFTSTQELATKAATELTHALLHPQPAGPFCKVGDEQTLALKRLADIFEGATRSHKSRVVTPPPAETVGNDTPPRVQITVSPPRIAKHRGWHSKPHHHY